MGEISTKDIGIECSDGFKLSATVFKTENPTAAIMISPATGIRKRFYKSFASHLAESGFGVITYDNRGIGDSINGSINYSNPSLIDWGTLDMTAVLECLKSNFPGTSYHLIGHSAGGQLIGLMQNAPDLKSFFTYASSSGSLRNMNFPFSVAAHFYMNFFIPTSNLLFSKTNSQWVGMGEALPKEVANQWRKWCNGKGYVETEFGSGVTEHYYYDLDLDSAWVYALDDQIAVRKNVDDMVRVYKKSKAEIISLNPKDYGNREIGHMKFFSSKNKELWALASDWIRDHS